MNSQGLGERKKIKRHGLLLQSFCTEKNQYVYLIVVNVNTVNISFISKINYLG